MRLLLDANVPRFASVSAYKKIAEKTTKWGLYENSLDVMEFGPPPYETAPRFTRENYRYIPALAIKAKSQGISFFTYDLLEKEYWKIRPAIDWARRDIRSIFAAKELPFDIDTGDILFSSFDAGAFDRYLNDIPSRITDLKLANLIDRLGNKMSRDCVHVWFADLNYLDALVTMDKTFIGRFNQIRSELGYNVRAVTPKEVCVAAGIFEIEEDWFLARDDPYIFYEPRSSVPVGDYIYTDEATRNIFQQETGISHRLNKAHSSVW